MLASFLYIERRTEPGISGSPAVVMALSQIDNQLIYDKSVFRYDRNIINATLLSIFLLSSGLARAACFLPFTEAKCRPEDETGTNQLFERFCLASVDINNLIKLAHFRFSICTLLCFSQISFQETLLTVK